MHASAIFYTLLVEPDLSQRELSDRTGCDKSTVSVIVKKFEDFGLVTRGDSKKSGMRGRPMESLRISEDTGLLIGIHLEFDTLRFAASSLGGVPIDILDRPLPSDPSRLGEEIRIGLEIFHRRIGLPAEAVQSVGVTVPGQIGDDGELVQSPNLHWQNVDIRRQLTAQITAPLFIDNDTKGAAMAERYFGVARKADDFLYITGGTGFGGAVFLDGQVYRGRSGFAGEIGHTKVVKDGRQCECGSAGCLAAYLTQKALVERSRLLDDAIVSLDEIEQRAGAGDDAVVDLLAESGGYVGMAVANVINMLNLPIVIIAGTPARLWPFIERGFGRALRANSLRGPLADTELRLSTLSNDAFPRGAIALALEGLIDLAGPATPPWSAS